MARISKAEKERREARLPLFKNIPVGAAFLSPLPGQPVKVCGGTYPNLERWTRTSQTIHGGAARNEQDGRIVHFQNYSTAFLVHE
jgi:hypothetical protein